MSLPHLRAARILCLHEESQREIVPMSSSSLNPLVKNRWLRLVAIVSGE
jgi:hypothetical protein